MKKRTRHQPPSSRIPSSEAQPSTSDDDTDSSAETPQEQQTPPAVPIVGIGASAGGLEAFEQFFTQMPADSGMAFVLVQHLDPTHKSILSDLVTRYTRMEVCQVSDNMRILPNRAYIIPPNRDMAILHGSLHLIEPTAPRGLRLPIDYFFRSLAQDQGDRAICVVLSGTGTDGTLGLRAVKGEGGMAMVQDPGSARYDGMPRSAISTGLVDYVLTPDKMPEELLAYVRQTFTLGVKKSTAPLPPPNAADYLRKIFILLRSQTGHDFFYYKPNTIHRRIERRMVVNQIERISDYVRLLQQNPVETETLFKELLIGVTNFFRDPDAFQALRDQVIPSLLEGRSPDVPIRIWVPACSTGEEAYSIALLFSDYAKLYQTNHKIQIFATDIDPDAIEVARTGIYPDSIAVDVPQAMLQHYFIKQGNSYQVGKQIRDMLVFAEQSLIKDPPFSKIDLLSCRNLLIYLQAEMQKTVLPVFHYALNPGGYLFLGTAEGIGDHTDLFDTLDRRWKIYRSKGDPTRLSQPLPFALAAAEPAHPLIKKGAMANGKISLREVVEQVLLDRFTPVCLLINEKYELLYVHGHAGRYLEPARGEASLNVLEMARDGLRLELTTAIRKAISHKAPVCSERVHVKGDTDDHIVNLTISRVTEPEHYRGLLLIVIEQVASQSREGQPQESHALPLVHGGEQHVEELEHELRSTKEYLQTTIEELETSNEELTSTNEELQSSNEELQSTNEELETSKEELQSVNEELVTVNTELQTKIEQLAKTTNDLSNLLVSTDIATLFLDSKLRVRRFTPALAAIFNLIETDQGRPITHIVSNLEIDDWQGSIQRVLETLEPIAREVSTRNGHWFIMRIRPYLTLEKIVDGVVITFTGIDYQKQDQEQLSQLALALEHSASCILVTDPKGIIQYVNPRFEEVTGYRLSELKGQKASLLKSGEHPPAFYRRLWSTISAGKEWQGMVRNRRKNGDLRWDETNIRPVQAEDGGISHFVCTQTDITQRKEAEDALRLTEARYALAQQAAGIGTWDWDLETDAVTWSEPLDRLFGYAQGEFPGTYTGFIERVHPEDRARVEEAIKMTLDQKRPYELSYRLRLPDGEERQVMAWGSVMSNAQGQPMRMLGAARRVTEADQPPD